MSNDNQIERLWKLQATVNKLVLDGKRDPREVSDILQGILESRQPQSFRKENGISYFSVGPTDGTTGQEWIPRLKGEGFLLGDATEVVLRSPCFFTTRGTVTEVAVIDGGLFRGNHLFSQRKLYEFVENFRTPDGRRLVTPKAEIACLIREKFVNQEIEAMGLTCIVTMHVPIVNERLEPWLLAVIDHGEGRLLRAFYTPNHPRLDCSWGYAFEVEEA